ERMKAARVFQLTTLALLVVSAVQVGYWVFDQRSYTIDKVHAARAAYAEQAAAAQALLDAGVSAERIQQMLSPIVVVGGHASLAPRVEEMLRTEERRRYNRLEWEGAFVMLTIGAGITVRGGWLRSET